MYSTTKVNPNDGLYKQFKPPGPAASPSSSGTPIHTHSDRTPWNERFEASTSHHGYGKGGRGRGNHEYGGGGRGGSRGGSNRGNDYDGAQRYRDDRYGNESRHGRSDSQHRQNTHQSSSSQPSRSQDNRPRSAASEGFGGSKSTTYNSYPDKNRSNHNNLLSANFNAASSAAQQARNAVPSTSKISANVFPDREDDNKWTIPDKETTFERHEKEKYLKQAKEKPNETEGEGDMTCRIDAIEEQKKRERKEKAAEQKVKMEQNRAKTVAVQKAAEEVAKQKAEQKEKAGGSDVSASTSNFYAKADKKDKLSLPSSSKDISSLKVPKKTRPARVESPESELEVEVRPVRKKKDKYGDKGKEREMLDEDSPRFKRKSDDGSDGKLKKLRRGKGDDISSSNNSGYTDLSETQQRSIGVLTLEERIVEVERRRKERRKARAAGQDIPTFSDDDENACQGDEEQSEVESEDGIIITSDGDSEIEILGGGGAPRQRERDKQLSISLQEAEDRRIRDGGTPDPLLMADVETVDAKTLCPFCSGPLPTNPSKRLQNLKDYLLERPNITDNPSLRNPFGKRLPVIETASFCRRHDEENTIIPAGIARGWPKTIEWDSLERRIRKTLYSHLMSILRKESSCVFFDLAKAEWERNGRKMNNILSEWGSFDIEQPGYYGPRGYEHFINVLRAMLEGCLSSVATEPLDPAVYLRRVLVPEVAVELIRVDLDCTREEAENLRRESSAFGKAMFASTNEDDEFAKAEEAREKRELEEQALSQSQEEERREEKEREQKRRVASAAEGKAAVKEQRRALNSLSLEQSSNGTRPQPRKVSSSAAEGSPWKSFIVEDSSGSGLDDDVAVKAARARLKPQRVRKTNKPADLPAEEPLSRPASSKPDAVSQPKPVRKKANTKSTDSSSDSDAPAAPRPTAKAIGQEVAVAKPKRLTKEQAEKEKRAQGQANMRKLGEQVTLDALSESSSSSSSDPE